MLLPLESLLFGNRFDAQGICTQLLDQLFCLRRRSLLGLGGGKSCTDIITNICQRALLRRQVLLHAYNCNGIGIQLDQIAVEAVVQHVIAERRIHDLRVRCQTLATQTLDRTDGLDGQTQCRCRLAQIGRFVGQVGQLLGRFHESTLNLLDFQLLHQLITHRLQRRYLRRLEISQLDQLKAVAGANRLGNLIRLQGEQRIVKGLVKAALDDIAQIATITGAAGVIRHLFGNLGKILTGCNTCGSLVDAGLGSGFIVTNLNQNVRGTTLLGQVADFALIQLLNGLFIHLDLVEEVLARQGQGIQHHALGGHELLRVGGVERLNFGIADVGIDLTQRDGQHGEITRLVFQVAELAHLHRRGKRSSFVAVTELGDQQLLAHQITEGHP